MHASSSFGRTTSLKVPASALFRDAEGWAAFVVERGRARKRPVVSPRRSAREAQIEGGVAEGETVILYPTDAIADGVSVTAR